MRRWITGSVKKSNEFFRTGKKNTLIAFWEIEKLPVFWEITRSWNLYLNIFHTLGNTRGQNINWTMWFSSRTGKEIFIT